MKVKQWIAAGVVAVTVFSLAAGLEAKGSEPFQLEADVIDYNSKTGAMQAKGANGVKLKQGSMIITGDKADYNMKTQAGVIIGNVKGVQENMTLTALQLETSGGSGAQHMIATGNVVLTKDNDRLTAPKIDYYGDKQVAIAEQDAKLVTEDGIITSDRMESFFKEKRSVAEGNVYIVSEKRNLQARSDHAVYYAAQGGEQGRIVLTGNARAVQDGNTVVGQTLTLYMEDKAVDASGRTKVVIAPSAN